MVAAREISFISHNIQVL